MNNKFGISKVFLRYKIGLKFEKKNKKGKPKFYEKVNFLGINSHR